MVGTDVDINGFAAKAGAKVGPTLPELLKNMPNAHVVVVEESHDASGVEVLIQQGENGGQVWREALSNLERRAPECSRVEGLLTAANNMRVEPYGSTVLPSQQVDEPGEMLAALLDEDGKFGKLDAPGVP